MERVQHQMKTLRLMEIGAFKEFGGKERHILDVAAGMAQQGHEVELVTRLTSHPVPGAPYIHTKLPLRNALDIKSLYQLVQIIKERKIDIIHVHNGREAWLAVMAAALAKRGRVVMSVHSMMTKPRKSWIYHWLFSRIDRVICVSEVARKSFLENIHWYPEQRTVVIPNGIALGRFLEAPDETREFRRRYQLQGRFLVGAVGKVDEAKIPLEFLQSLPPVLRANPKTTFVFTGKVKEEYRPILREECRRLGLEKSIVYIPFTENVSPILRALDILVFPSKGMETFGLSVAEAMACGTPVIACDCGGVRDLLIPGCGVLVEQGDREMMTQSIIELMQNQDKAFALGQQGKRWIEQNFTLEKMCQRLEVLFQDLLEEEGCQNEHSLAGRYHLRGCYPPVGGSDRAQH